MFLFNFCLICIIPGLLLSENAITRSDDIFSCRNCITAVPASSYQVYHDLRPHQMKNTKKR